MLLKRHRSDRRTISYYELSPFFLLALIFYDGDPICDSTDLAFAPLRGRYAESSYPPSMGLVAESPSEILSVGPAFDAHWHQDLVSDADARVVL